jgi:hypothetical protein
VILALTQTQYKLSLAQVSRRLDTSRLLSTQHQQALQRPCGRWCGRQHASAWGSSAEKKPTPTSARSPQCVAAHPPRLLTVRPLACRHHATGIPLTAREQECAVSQAVADRVAAKTFSHILGFDLATLAAFEPATLTNAIERGQQGLQLGSSQQDLLLCCCFVCQPQLTGWPTVALCHTCCADTPTPSLVMLPAAKINIRTLFFKVVVTAAPTLVGLLWVLVLLSTSCNFGWTVPAAVCCTWGAYVAWTLQACQVQCVPAVASQQGGRSGQINLHCTQLVLRQHQCQKQQRSVPTASRYSASC